MTDPLPEPLAIVEKCSCCPEPATADVWTKPVCVECFRAWMREAPFPKDVEDKARPDQFEAIHIGTYMSLKQLKPGLLERFYLAWTTKWIERQLASMRGAA